MATAPPILIWQPAGGVPPPIGANVPASGYLYYWPSIENLTGGNAVADLDAQNIAGLPSDSLIIVITESEETHWLRVADASDPVTNLDAGIIVPTNYDQFLRPYVLHQTLVGSGVGVISETRITLSGDTRVTSTGDTRVTPGSSGIGVTDFLALTDTPDDYAGQIGKVVKVNTTEDGLEFGFVSSGGGGGGGVINVLDYGVVADHQTLTDVSMTGGSAVITSAAYTFVSGDVGKYVVVRGGLGAVDGISPLHGTIVSVSGHTATLSQATSAWPAGIYTPQMDFGTDNVDNFRTAIQAMPAGGTVIIPAGRYFIGATKYNPPTSFHTVGFPWNGDFEDQFPATAAGGTLRGDGMGATRLYYSSSFALVGGVNSGAGILVGLTPAGGYTGISISDFSITDLNPFTQDGGTGINVWGVDNFRLERVEFINCKGNSAFNYQGASPHSPSPGGGAYGVNIFIRDCIARGDVSGGWINGDGFNVGNVRNFHFTGNTITGVLRHGFEGGGSCYNQFFENNYIDMQGQGGAGINPTGGSNSLVANNIILNVVGGSDPIDFTTDVGDFSISNEIVTGNYITGGQWAVKFQRTGGGIGTADKYIVSNNWIEGAQYGVHSVGGVLIHNNRFILVGNYLLYQAGGTATPVDADQIIDIRGNVVNAGIAMTNGSYGGFDDAYQIKIENNTIGGTLEDAAGIAGTVNPVYGNLGRVYSPTGGSLAAGTVLTGLTAIPVNFMGTRELDTVEVIPGPNWPKNLVYYGAAAADTVTIYVFNPTSGAVTYPAASLPASPNFIYYAVHRR